MMSNIGLYIIELIGLYLAILVAYDLFWPKAKRDEQELYYDDIYSLRESERLERFLGGKDD